MLDRRKFSLALGLATLWPVGSLAQQSSAATIRIGFIPLGSSANAYDRSLVEAFREGLNKVGLTENRQVVVDVAWVDTEQGYAKALDEMRMIVTRVVGDPVFDLSSDACRRVE